MRVLIFGAGAVGSALATMLSSHHEIDVAARGERSLSIAGDGITVNGAAERTSRPGTGPRGHYDMVFIATKAYDVVTASDEMMAFVDRDTIIVSPQNGLHHVDVLTERFGDRVVLAPTTMGATTAGPASVRLVSTGMTVVGSPSGRAERAAEVAAVLNGAGLRSEVSDNIAGEVWIKAVVNACINPIAALAGVPNGVLLERRPLLTIAESTCSEAVAAAVASGITLPRRDVFAWVKEVMRTTGENRCSMLRDLEMGRRTEIDEINGELVQKGESRGVPMIVNRSLWTMVRTAEGRQSP